MIATLSVTVFSIFGIAKNNFIEMLEELNSIDFIVRKIGFFSYKIEIKGNPFTVARIKNTIDSL
jgi:hypothetical protein